MNRLFILGMIGFLSSFMLKAQIRLPRLISDGMILQRDRPVKIWGWATANEEITLLFKGQQYQTITGSSGKWEILIPAQKTEKQPFEIVLKGRNEIRIKNVLLGDVWVCSGQSNMELTMDRVKDRYAEIISEAENPAIRQFLVPDKYDFKVQQEDVESGSWQPATQQNILSFSAVGYFFARELFERYHVPIGLINSALGGSPVEAWLSEDAVKQFPEHYLEAQKFRNSSLITEIEGKDKMINLNWYKTLNQQDKGLQNHWKKASFNDSDWQQMELPDFWSTQPLGNVHGTVWFRKTIKVPGAMAGKPAKLLLGRIVDADSVFINDTFVGTTGYQYPPRRYFVPANVLKEGSNTIVVRVINNAGEGGFIRDKPYYLISGKDSISLTGTWKYQLGTAMPELPEQTFIRWKPVGLYNAMISPLRNYAMKGVIWFQGESNTKAPKHYFDYFKALVNDWREKWGQGDFPFLYVQLANFMKPASMPAESKWAELRQNQLLALTIRNTGMAVSIDLGEWNDIHPLNKLDVGHRLALQARKTAYAESGGVYAGPLFKSVQKRKEKLIIRFSNAGSGLKTIPENNALKQFAVAGKDKYFVWANAAILGHDKVLIWSDEVKNPVFVRYAWADNPEGPKLYNKENLPASPFQISATGKGTWIISR